MEIQNVLEHTSCCNYVRESDAIFRVQNFKEGQWLHYESEKPYILFLLSGKLMMVGDNCKRCSIEGGQMMLKYKKPDFCAQAEKDGCLLMCHLSTDLNLCNRFTFQQLTDFAIPDNLGTCCHIEAVHPRIMSFLVHLGACLEDGVGCKHYHQLKRDELLIYLRVYYAKKALAVFFHPLVSQDIDFKEFVLTHYKNMHSITEFAEKANLSLSTFNRRFKEAFHTQAQKWLIARRSENILRDIVMSHLPFAEIAEKYEFSSTAYFNTFCKKHYGKTPSTLRKDGMNAFSQFLNDEEI